MRRTAASIASREGISIAAGGLPRPFATAHRAARWASTWNADPTSVALSASASKRAPSSSQNASSSLISARPAAAAASLALAA